jgi:hypothetical protein
MKIPVSSLASLKRAIAVSNVCIRVLKHWQSQLEGTTRTPIVVRKNGKPGVQTNGYYFVGRDYKGAIAEMWCPLPKATELAFNEDGSVTFYPNTERSWTLLFEEAA